MVIPRRPPLSEPTGDLRPFGATDLLQLLLAAARPTLGFDLAVAVLCEDGTHVVPVFTTGPLSAGALEGVHVQALAAFASLAGPDHASWPSTPPDVIDLPGIDGRRPVEEPSDYEDAPLVVGGNVTGMLRISRPSAPTDEQTRLYYLLAADVSKAIERLDRQRDETRLVQERLLQSEKMSSVGQLVSGVAHELNNPLTGITGFAQMLLLRDLEPGARKQVETIYQEAERASKIVSNLLTFARRRKPTKEPANLNALIERVLELRNYDLRVRNIDVEMQLDASLPETMVDTNQIQQVFLNVVINAEQAMRSEGGHGRFVIRSGVVEGNVRITFQDSGPGMSAETVRRVFDPFFTTKDAGEGTGLGLTISYGIIEEHGGRIWAESEPGRGTAFHVDLPVLAGVSSVPTELRREPERVTENADRHRILIVDDEDSIQKLLTGVLEMDGHKVSVASNGREALEQLMRDSFDLIITDIKMPVMSGTDLYRRLSDDGSPLARRLIFVTGDTVAPETRKFLETVDNAVLSKPFRLRDVRETVRATLSK